MRKHVIFATLCSLALTACRDSGIVSTESLLREMISEDAVATVPSPYYKTCQVSSYDRRTVAPDKAGWFANDDGFGFERLDTLDGRVEKVLFEEECPGAVTRIWMTTRNKKGTLRFYLDGSGTPDIVVPAYDMTKFPVETGASLSLTHTHYDGNLEGVGGNTFFFPIPFAKSCRITLEEPDINDRIPRYYHVTYRKYAEGTKVKTFSLDEAAKLESLVSEVNEALAAPEDDVPGERLALTLASGEDPGTIVLPSGEKMVRRLFLDVDCSQSSLGTVMRESRVKISFDGEECVDCPLDCFFGAGSGAPEVKDWYMASDGKGSFVSRWPMPYSKEAKITLESASDSLFNATLTCVVDDYAFGANTLYFHATYKEEDGVAISDRYDSNDNGEWMVAGISGRGNYCGDVFSLYNDSPAWYGEGDEKIWIDDDAFPSTMGTGLEDYYNCSWAPVKPFNTPFGGAIRADEESSHGYNTFMRTRNLDIMPFGEKFEFFFEMLCWVPGTIDIRAASYWYADLDAKAY